MRTVINLTAVLALGWASAWMFIALPGLDEDSATTSPSDQQEQQEQREEAKRLFEKARLFNSDQRSFEAIQLLRQLIQTFPKSPYVEPAKASIKNMEKGLLTYLATEVNEIKFFLKNKEAAAARQRIDLVHMKWPEHPLLPALQNQLLQLERN